MKKMMFALLPAVLALTLMNCGGGGGGTKDPSKVDFDNPDGTVTEANATDVQNDALSASQTQSLGSALQGLGKLEPRREALVAAALQKSRQLSSVFNQSQADCSGHTSVDETLEASQVNNAECTYDGSVRVKAKLTDACELVSVELTFNNFTFDCTDGSGSCDGSLSLSNSGAMCVDMTCEAEGETQSANACYLGSDILVSGDGGNVVCTGLTPDADCGTLTATWEDADGPLTLTCDVTDKDDTSCPPSAAGVRAVDNCVVTR